MNSLYQGDLSESTASRWVDNLILWLPALTQCQVEESTRMAGEITGTLGCGRGLQFFHHPETATKAQAITERVQKLPNATPREGLEFIRSLDQRAISGVIMAPPTASLVFIIAWLSVYLRKTKENDGKVDIQSIVATAFTVASYLVTAGKYCRYDGHSRRR